MRKFLLSTAAAALIAVSAAGSAQAYDHYYHGGGYYHNGWEHHHAHWHTYPVVVGGGVYAPYVVPAYPAPYPVMYAPPPGVSLGVSIR